MTEPLSGRSIAPDGGQRKGHRVNNVSLLGFLVGDPQLRVDHAGRDVCSMQVAVPRRRLTGEFEPGVIYVDVAVFGQQAHDCAANLAAGARIGVSGTLEREDSLDHEPRRSRWEVHAHQVDMIDQSVSSEAG
jgi:single-strand DNA-binding protein